MDDYQTFFTTLKKKWLYNFVISPKTNLVDKPEWYLNQTLKWIHEHIDSVPGKHEFIQSMLELAMTRLKKDVEVLDNEETLIHTYNEVIQFTKITHRLLGDQYYKMGDEFDLLGVFAAEKVFETIVDVEWGHAHKNLKQICNSQNRWDSLLGEDFVDPYNVPRCVDQLMMLISAIKSRIELFRQIDCQFNLIELQCSLFAKFLVFLKRSLKQQSLGTSLVSSILFLSDESQVDSSHLERVTNGTKLIKLLLKEKLFIPERLLGEDLNSHLLAEVQRLSAEYNEFHDELIDLQHQQEQSSLD